MADNTQLSTNSGTGDKLATKDVTHGGDAGVKIQSVTLMGVSGTEGAYTIADINGDATNGLDVDVTRVPAPLSTTGGGTEATALRVTIATDSTGVVSIDDNGASLTVDGTVTANAGSGTFTIAGAVTNAGTFAVQESGGALTALQLIDDAIIADDAAFTPATTKVMMAGFEFDDTTPDSVNEGDAGAARMSANRNVYVNIRDNAGNERGLNVDANGAIAVTDGASSLTVDNAALSVTGGGVEASALRVTIASDSTGVVSVDDNGGSLTVDNGGTFAVQATVAAGATNIAKAEDAASADADVGVPAMAVRKATPANTSGTDGDYEMLQMSAGRLWTSSTIDAAIPAGTNAIGKLAANSGVDIGDVDILSIAAGDNNIGNVDIVTMPNVTLAAGTNTNEVVGDVAHDAAVAGNPVLIAGSAQTMDDTAPPNRVSAESDATRAAMSLDGALFVHPHGPQVWTYHVNGSSALTDTTVHAAPGAGLSLYVGTIVISSGAATAMNAFFEEGASTVMGPYYLEAVAGRGCTIHFTPPRKITANTALTVTTSAAIAHSIDVTGFTAPS